MTIEYVPLDDVPGADRRRRLIDAKSIIGLLARSGAAGDAMTADVPLEAEEFLTWLAVERGRSANTLAAYRRDLRALRARG